MRQPRLVRGELLLASGLLLGIWAHAARADVLPPEPQTVWQRGEAPRTSAIVIAGLALSGAILSAGLIAARWQVSSPRGRLAAVGTALAAIAAVGAIAAGVYRAAARDQRAWAEYDQAVESRRRNWRPPPGNFGVDPPPPPAAPEVQPPLPELDAAPGN